MPRKFTSGPIVPRLSIKFPLTDRSDISSTVLDGTYITNPNGAVLNQTSGSYSTDVSVMLGWNRDEFGIYLNEAAYPGEGATFASQISGVFGNLLRYDHETNTTTIIDVSAPGFPIPGPNPDPETPREVWNAIVRFLTSIVFDCPTLARAYAGATSGAVKDAYSFEFNRTYQMQGWTQPWCDAPADVGPELGEYHKCHAGEQFLAWGTVARQEYPDRDGLDLPFARLVVDYFTSYVRTGDPNPDLELLRIKGHWSTLERISKTGRWDKVDDGGVRLLQWEGRQIPVNEVDQDVCEVVGMQLDALLR